MQITRKRLIDIVDRAIEAGKEEVPEAVRGFKTQQLQRIARSCEGVDYGIFHCKYGCPVIQASLIVPDGAFWFTSKFDALMNQEFDTFSGSTLLGYSVEVID